MIGGNGHADNTHNGGGNGVDGIGAADLQIRPK